MKVSLTLEPEHFQHPSDSPHWELSALVDAEREGINNPESKLLWWKQTVTPTSAWSAYTCQSVFSDHLMVLQKNTPAHQPTFGSIWEDGSTHSYMSLQDICEAFLSKKCVP